MRFENSVVIDRPIDEVFDFIANFENMPRWNYFVLAVDKRTAGPVGVGTIYHQVRKTDEQDYEVIRYEPNRTIAVNVTPDPQLTMTFKFEKDGNRTRLTDTWELKTGLNHLIEGLASFKIKSSVAANLRKLKELLEKRRVELQDGRVVTL